MLKLSVIMFLNKGKYLLVFNVQLLKFYKRFGYFEVFVVTIVLKLALRLKALLIEL